MKNWSKVRFLIGAITFAPFRLWASVILLVLTAFTTKLTLLGLDLNTTDVLTGFRKNIAQFYLVHCSEVLLRLVGLRHKQ